MGKTCSSVGSHDDQIGIFFFGGLNYSLSSRPNFYKEAEMFFLILYLRVLCAFAVNKQIYRWSTIIPFPGI